MININDKQYNDYDIKVSWISYEVTRKGKKEQGLSPFIKFKVNNSYIGLETIIDSEILRKMEFNKEINIKDYLSDITYEDKDGWISLIIDEYDLVIKRIDKELYNINFYVNNDEIKIVINTDIKII